jgi:Pup amidohydrolase
MAILAGTETEYGLYVEGRGAEDQVDDAMGLVRGYPGEAHVGWNYRYESPRADLRGFVLDRLAVDPEDVKFDVGRQRGPDKDIRSDRVLPNGARFYNDHGHPEYSTPECWSLEELGLHDKAGEIVVHAAARVMAEQEGREVRVYKNNTDFHGASYGSHESYLLPRRMGFDKLFPAVTPMLVARQILTGAGKVGSETGPAATYQISQRADFFSEAANAETLYRRPVFNTRDEAHAPPQDWTRLHVISGDANMMAACTARKAGLVKLALELALIGETPHWPLADPVRAFQAISRDETYEFRVPLEGRNWTTAYEILESYFATAERFLELDKESVNLIAECRTLMPAIRAEPKTAQRSIDWLAKRTMLENYMESEGTDWRDPSLRAFDLEYHNVDPEEGLYHALAQMGDVEPEPEQGELMRRLSDNLEGTRALARGIAVKRFGKALSAACWRTITLVREGSAEEIELPPNATYPAELRDVEDVGTFIQLLRGVS